MMDSLIPMKTIVTVFENSRKYILLPASCPHSAGPRRCHQEHAISSVSTSCPLKGQVLCFALGSFQSLPCSSHQRGLPVSASVWMRLTPASASGVCFIAPKTREVECFKYKLSCL